MAKQTKPQIEAKALAAESKSAGMRMLYDAGYQVAAVAKVFDAPYGFAYGVAVRHGVAESAAARRAPRAETKATKAKPSTAKAKAPVATKTAAKPVVKVTKVAGRTTKVSRSARPARPADTTSAVARVSAKLAAKQPGRPTTARRAANRKVRAAKA